MAQAGVLPIHPRLKLEASRKQEALKAPGKAEDKTEPDSENVHSETDTPETA